MPCRYNTDRADAIGIGCIGARDAGGRRCTQTFLEDEVCRAFNQSMPASHEVDTAYGADLGARDKSACTTSFSPSPTTSGAFMTSENGRPSET